MSGMIPSIDIVQQQRIQISYRNNLIQSILNAMAICQFELASTSMTYPYSVNFFNFVQKNRHILYLPNHPNSIYNCEIHCSISESWRTVRLQIILNNFSIEGKIIQFRKYDQLLSNLQPLLNKQTENGLFFYNSELNFIGVSLQRSIQIFFNYQYVMNLWNKTKQKVIDILLTNIQFQNNFTSSQLIQLTISRTIYQSNRIYSEGKRLDKQVNSVKFKKSEIKYIDEIQKSLIQYMLTGKQTIRDPNLYELAKYRRTEMKEFQKLIMQRENNQLWLQSQTKISLYEMALLEMNEKGSLVMTKTSQKTETMGLKKTQQESIKFQKVNKSNHVTSRICQGMNVLSEQKSKQKNKTQQQQQYHQKYFPYIGYFICYIRYQQSIHGFTDNHTKEQHDKMNSKQQDNLGQQNNDDRTLPNGNLMSGDTEKKLLVKKSCVDTISGRNSFVNEYNFIKFIRDRTFPYIARYYLQAIPESKSKSTSTSKQQPDKYEQIVKRSIYSECYEQNLNQYLDSGRQSGQQRTIDKIMRLLKQLAATFRFLEHNNLLHRDIKPTNVMIDCRQNVRLIDWGSCCSVIGTKEAKPDKIYKDIQQSLKTTTEWSQDLKEILKRNPKAFWEQFDGDQQRFQKNPFFDIYSLGIIIEEFIKQISVSIQSNHWLIWQLKYLQEKCKETNPFDRLRPLDILMYVNGIIRILQGKRRIQGIVERSTNEIIIID